MKTVKHLLYILPILFLSSCTQGSTEGEENPTQDNTENCLYSYNPEATVLTWTAFKLTEKIAVNGSFDEINVVANNDSKDMFTVLTGATFEIPVSSLNSQDPVRDPKIKNSFFGNMNETSAITGTVVSISAKSASISITMNGVTKEYTGDVILEDETITVTTSIEITDFDAHVAMDSLSVVCAEKHTGPDGVNKFWSTVDIAVKTTLQKKCN